jgi:hypothetical protein
MNFSDIEYPSDTRHAVRAALVREAGASRRRAPWWRRPAALTFAGIALAGSTAAMAYVAFAPVEDKRDIRCYYRADLTSTYPAGNGFGGTVGPYLSASVAKDGFDVSGDNGTDPLAGNQQIEDPVALCAFNWDQGLMNPGGATDDLIPPGFQGPAPRPSQDYTGKATDVQGNPAPAMPNNFGPGHYVPELTACVVDDAVAVIPGPHSVCAQLGIPTLDSGA